MEAEATVGIRISILLVERRFGLHDWATRRACCCNLLFPWLLTVFEIIQHWVKMHSFFIGALKTRRRRGG